MVLSENRLITMKQEIEKAKQEVGELTGQKKYLMNELKTSWNCETLDEAELLIEKMQNGIKTMEDKLDTLIRNIKEKYNV